MLFPWKKIKIILYATILLFGYKALAYFISPETEAQNFHENSHTINLNDNGLMHEISSSAKDVRELLREYNISLHAHDELYPKEDTILVSGTNIHIRRATRITIKVDGRTLESYTLQKDVGLALTENNIFPGHLDKVEPSLTTIPRENIPIVITRINVEEKVIPEEIDFKTIYESDDTLSWREEKIKQEGEKGIQEVRYLITYKDGTEVSRKLLGHTKIKSPLSRILAKGTYMKLSKPQKGIGTWYSFKGGLYAASTSLPRGSFAKVTNTANGKSVVVEINDYGPRGKGRIIDLDKVAFTKIAPPQSGVAQVKVEEILN